MRKTDEEETSGEQMDRRERVVLHLLFSDGFPWTVWGLGRELGDRGDVKDAVAALDGLDSCIASRWRALAGQLSSWPARRRLKVSTERHA
jgi:hypothetical protein